MATKNVPVRLAKHLYRCMLRSSKMGKHPEVWGAAGAGAFVRQTAHCEEHLAMSLPQSPLQVRRRLKFWFQKPLWVDKCVENNEKLPGAVDSPLQALRSAQMNASLLSMSDEEDLPIFLYDRIAALPNESIQFCFVEPRYLQLAARVWGSPNRQFLLKARLTDNTATLLQLQSYLVLPNRMVAVSCLGGPRVFVRNTTSDLIEEEVDPQHATAFNLTKVSKMLHIATDKDLCPDKDHVDPSSFDELRQYILHLLHCILPLQDSSLSHTLEAFGLPPLDAEGFSYWVLRHTLAETDVTGRLFWTHKCFSTKQRLDFLVQELEDILEYQSEQAARQAA